MNRQQTIALRQIVTGLLVVGFLAVGVTAILLADRTNRQDVPAIATISPQKLTRQRPLPDRIATAVLTDASSRLALPIKNLNISTTEAKQWSDGCLGLAAPDTLCTQRVVSGWRVAVEGGGQTLVYRTDSQGSLVKLEK